MVGLDNPFTTIAANILGTANTSKRAGSTGWTASSTRHRPRPTGIRLPAPVSEDAPLRPNDVYGATKAAGEALVGAYSDQHGLDGVSLRISWVYGPRRRTDCLIRTLIDDALSGRPTHLEFGAGFHRQYVYVSDVVASILAALDAPSYPSRVYNVTGGAFATLDEVGAVVQRVLPQARSRDDKWGLIRSTRCRRSSTSHQSVRTSGLRLQSASRKASEPMPIGCRTAALGRREQRRRNPSSVTCSHHP